MKLSRATIEEFESIIAFYDDVTDRTPDMEHFARWQKRKHPTIDGIRAYTEAFRYMEEQGYKVAGQHRTCYIDGAWNQEDPEKWLSIIQIPIE